MFDCSSVRCMMPFIDATTSMVHAHRAQPAITDQALIRRSAPHTRMARASEAAAAHRQACSQQAPCSGGGPVPAASVQAQHRV